jgi:hypothetical protein
MASIDPEVALAYKFPEVTNPHAAPLPLSPFRFPRIRASRSPLLAQVSFSYDERCGPYRRPPTGR